MTSTHNIYVPGLEHKSVETHASLGKYSWVSVFQESFYGNNLGFWSEVVVKYKDGLFSIQCVIKSLKRRKNRVNHSQMAGLFSDWRHKRRNSIKHVQDSSHISSSSLDQGVSTQKSLTYLRLLGLLHGDESSWRVAGQSLFAVADESQTGVKRHHLLTVPADHSTVSDQPAARLPNETPW